MDKDKAKEKITTCPPDKIEKVQGITFINTYSVETDPLTLSRFKRDMAKMLKNTN